MGTVGLQSRLPASEVRNSSLNPGACRKRLEPWNVGTGAVTLVPSIVVGRTLLAQEAQRLLRVQRLFALNVLWASLLCGTQQGASFMQQVLSSQRQHVVCAARPQVVARTLHEDSATVFCTCGVPFCLPQLDAPQSQPQQFVRS